MIPRSDVAVTGTFGKPHGVKGEVSVNIDPDMADIYGSINHVFVDIDGLLVPFFIVSVRRKGAETLLLTLKGVDSENAASAFANKAVYIEKELLPDAEDDEGNFYLEDLIGFKVKNGETHVGTVEDYDDSTENVLLAVRTPAGEEVLIPAVDDLIEDIDTDTKTITMSLPEGLV